MKVGGMIGATLQVLRKNSGIPPIKANENLQHNSEISIYQNI